MLDIKAFLEHEVLNLLTLINMIVATEESMKGDKKEEIADLIKLASLLISNESVFESGKKQAFIEDVNLQEIIDIVMLMYENQFKEKEIKASWFNEIVLVKTDKNLLKELLEGLMRKLVSQCSSIRFAFRKMENKLVIFYQGPLIEIKQKDPLALLKQSAPVPEILFQCTLKFVLSIGLKIQRKEGKIEIYFPKE